MGLVLWLQVDGWPCAPYLAAKVATGKTFLKPPAHYVETGGEGGSAFWDAVGWAVLAVDTPGSPRQGYEGLLEHVTVRFVAECSRICSHELVRHRMASYAQTSTRLGAYASGLARLLREICEQLPEPEEIIELRFDRPLEGFQKLGLDRLCVLPEDELGRLTVAEACIGYLEAICLAVLHDDARLVDEALRYAQPDALKSHVMVTTNLRELLHILQLRLHPRAHWEIRKLATELADKLWSQYRIPVHLMLALKRPGILDARKDLKPLVEKQLEWLRRGNQKAANQVEALLSYNQQLK